MREHGLKLAAKGGRAAKKKAVIAIARKLAVMMIAMWQQGSSYEAFPSPRKRKPSQSANNKGGAASASKAKPECEKKMATS